MLEKLKSWNTLEPARLRTLWAAVVTVLVVFGVQQVDLIDARAQAVITLVGVIVTVLQGESTRSAVYSPATAEVLADQDPNFDEVADH